MLPTCRRSARRPVRLIGLATLVVALAWWRLPIWSAAAQTGTPDPFYDPPVVLLRSEPFTRAAPAGAQAWRILYTTTRDDQTPAVASALVVVSASLPTGPRPVIAWAHGTVGIDRECAPSLAANPFENLPAFDRLLAQGWILVATDYIGLGTPGPHPYLIGQGEARSVLDSVRAAQQLDGLNIENRIVVWGHSQGGHAALWTGILAPSYAPDLNIEGVAALAPASDITAILAAPELQASGFGKLATAYLVGAWGQTYADVRADRLIRPEAGALVGAAAKACLSNPDADTLAAAGAAQALDGVVLAVDPATDPVLSLRLAENTPNHLVSAPLFIGQGLADDVVLPRIQSAYVEGRCAAGQRLEYRTYARRDHLTVLAADSALSVDLMEWTADRLAGEPLPLGCQQAAR